VYGRKKTALLATAVRTSTLLADAYSCIHCKPAAVAAELLNLVRLYVQAQ
jgi:hypothetical protein